MSLSSSPSLYPSRINSSYGHQHTRKPQTSLGLDSCSNVVDFRRPGRSNLYGLSLNPRWREPSCDLGTGNPYQGSTRRIEPYSLRRTQEDNIILHAWSVDRDAHRSYRLDRIEGARTTSQTFSPRYAVELTPTGPVAISAGNGAGCRPTKSAVGKTCPISMAAASI